MGRRPCCRKEGLNRGSWSAFEDKLLINYIEIHGEGKWRDVPEKAGLRRCGKSCRLRWLNYLRPDIKRGNFSVEEDDLIIRLHKLLGNRWSLIAGRLPGRTDNEIKNYWNSNLSKRVGSCGMHLRKSRMKNGCTKNYTIEPKQARATADEPIRVIRTKAIRCSKVVIPGLVIDNQNLEIVGETNPSAAAPLEDDLAVSLMDFDISELLLPDAPMNSASPKTKEIDEHGGNRVAELGDYNVHALPDLSYHSNHDPHFAHGANFDNFIDEILADNHGTIAPFPEILDLRSSVEESINHRQIDLDPQKIEPCL